MLLVDRRHFVAFVTATMICVLRRSGFGQASNPDAETIERWMNDWMGATKQPRGTLHVSRFKDPIYFLMMPISWKPNPGQPTVSEVSVPKGFVTDFASIPRLFWSLLRPDGDYTYPAIIHDFLYWDQKVTRADADLTFKLAMEDFGIPPITVATIYNAVRIGGESSWKDNASQKGLGERRILKRFPTDPRTTWNEWKREPDVFTAE